MPSSAVVPKALPAWLVSHHRTGGSHLYGPSIFSPALALDQVATLSSVGFCQCSVVAMFLYEVSTEASGGLSLPKAHTNGLAWARSARIWLSSEALATAVCSAVHFVSFSQALQQTKPGIRMMPAWSAMSYSSSLPRVPSNRIALSPMLLT